MAQKVKFGLSNCYIAKRTVSSEGVVSYDTPTKFAGAVNLSLDPQGDSSDFYADNIKYFSTFANSGYEGDFEVADVPENVLTSYLGYKKDTKGRLVETTETGASFALLFQVETDEKARRFCLFNCAMSRPSQEFNTIEDTLDPQTSTLSLTISGESVDGTNVYIMLANQDATDYATFFDAVSLPEFE